MLYICLFACLLLLLFFKSCCYTSKTVRPKTNYFVSKQIICKELFRKLAVSDSSHASLSSQNLKKSKTQNDTGRYHFSWTILTWWITFNHVIGWDMVCSLHFMKEAMLRCPSYLMDALLLLTRIFNIPSISFKYMFSSRLALRCNAEKPSS